MSVQDSLPLHALHPYGFGTLCHARRYSIVNVRAYWNTLHAGLRAEAYCPSTLGEAVVLVVLVSAERLRTGVSVCRCGSFDG